MCNYIPDACPVNVRKLDKEILSCDSTLSSIGDVNMFYCYAARRVLESRWPSSVCIGESEFGSSRIREMCALRTAQMKRIGNPPGITAKTRIVATKRQDCRNRAFAVMSMEASESSSNQFAFRYPASSLIGITDVLVYHSGSHSCSELLASRPILDLIGPILLRRHSNSGAGWSGGSTLSKTNGERNAIRC